MPRVHFLGRVLPDSIRVTLARNPYVFAKHEASGLEATTELQILDSNVNVMMDLNRFETARDLQHAVNRAQDLADAAINVLTLQTGNAFLVVLDKILTPDGKIADVHCKELEFPRHMTALVEQANFEHVVVLALRDNELRMALRDLTEMLRQNYIGAIGAARDVESIRNYFIPPSRERNEGWEFMRKALNATESYVKSITDRSRGPRHADWSDDGEEESRKVMERAWILMNRFLEYRKRNDQQLPESEFPILDLNHR